MKIIILKKEAKDIIKNIFSIEEIQEKIRKEKEARLIKKMCEYAETLNW